MLYFNKSIFLMTALFCSVQSFAQHEIKSVSVDTSNTQIYKLREFKESTNLLSPKQTSTTLVFELVKAKPSATSTTSTESIWSANLIKKDQNVSPQLIQRAKSLISSELLLKPIGIKELTEVEIAHQQLINPPKIMADVTFLNEVQYKYRPQFSRELIRQMCRVYATQLTSAPSPSATAPDGALIIHTQFKVNTTGKITDYTVTPMPEDNTLPAQFKRTINNIRFYPYNENGIPVDFYAEQPFNFDCKA